MQKGAEAEIRREARLLLTRMSRTTGYLKITATRHGYALFSNRNKYAKPVAKIPAELVKNCIALQLLAHSEGEVLRITAAGRRWIRNAEHVGLEASALPNAGIADDPLSWLAKRKSKDGKVFLERQHLAAAEKFRRDFEMSQFMPSITSQWSPVHANRKERRGDIFRQDMAQAPRLLAAKQRFQKACDILGPELADIVLEVCCLMRGLEAAEKRLGWPKRSAKVVLKIALGRLIDHYQLPGSRHAGDVSQRIRTMTKPGYRPEIAPEQPE